MTDMELLDILGGVKGKYILEAQKMREGRKKAPRFRYVRQLAAVIALILMLAIFLMRLRGQQHAASQTRSVISACPFV